MANTMNGTLSVERTADDCFTDEYGDRWFIAGADGRRCWAVNREDGMAAGEVAYFPADGSHDLYARQDGAAFDGELCCNQYVVRNDQWEECDQ